MSLFARGTFAFFGGLFGVVTIAIAPTMEKPPTRSSSARRAAKRASSAESFQSAWARGSRSEQLDVTVAVLALERA